MPKQIITETCPAPECNLTRNGCSSAMSKSDQFMSTIRLHPGASVAGGSAEPPWPLLRVDAVDAAEPRHRLASVSDAAPPKHLPE